jgi:sugar lactone lactonase YvrE
MRWLWKDWPAPVKAGRGSPQLREILHPDEGWQVLAEGLRFADGPAANSKGEVFFTDIPAKKAYRVGLDGKVAPFNEGTKQSSGQAFGPDGKLYSIAVGENKVVALDQDGKTAMVADGIRGNDLVVDHSGNVFVTSPGPEGTRQSKVWHVNAKGERKVVDTGLKLANGVTLSPDQTLLYVSDTRTRWVYSYQVQPDGTLTDKQRYFHLHEPNTADESGADGMAVDREGRLWVATYMGLQVCDPAGRVTCIIPTPNGKVFHVCFGGPEMDTLFALCGDRVYKRKVKVKGVLPFQAPFKPAPPRL